MNIIELYNQTVSRPNTRAGRNGIPLVLNVGAVIGFPVGRNERTRTGVTWAGALFAGVAGSVGMPWPIS